MAHRLNLASESCDDRTATQGSHQIRAGDTAKSLGWDRSPVRRKDHRRKKSKVPRSCSIRGTCKIGMVVVMTLFYYTTSNRATPLIVGLDALICMHTLQHAATSSTWEKVRSFTIPTLVTPPVGDNHNYLEVLQKLWNKLMHSYVGNPAILSLDLLIPHSQDTTTTL